MPHHQQDRIRNFLNLSVPLVGAQADVSLLAAPGAGSRICITDVVIHVSVDANVTLSSDTALLIIPIKADVPLVLSLNTPLMCPVNTSLNITYTEISNATVNLAGYILS